MASKRFCDICGEEDKRLLISRAAKGFLVDYYEIMPSVVFHRHDGPAWGVDQGICSSCADKLILKLLSEEKRKELDIING